VFVGPTVKTSAGFTATSAIVKGKLRCADSAVSAAVCSEHRAAHSATHVFASASSSLVVCGDGLKVAPAEISELSAKMIPQEKQSFDISSYCHW
jgi:hypothetical protein